MPKHNRNKSLKGGSIQAPSCSNQFDVSQYTKPCSSGSLSLPLDKSFQDSFPQSAGSKSKSGGGFTVSTTNIGNMPQIVGYDDCCPPVLLKNGGLVTSNNFQPLCGSQTGGKKKSHKSHKSHKSRKSRKSVRKTRKTRKTRKSVRKTKGRHHGGGVEGMHGVDGNFSPDMTTRDFSCKQPFWQPKCM